MAKAFVSGVGWAEAQSEVVDITDNGTIEILPDKATVFNKVTINTNVPHYDDGFVDGKQAERKWFWEIFQNFGNLKSYYVKFTGGAGSMTWRDELYNPIYELDCTGNQQFGASEVFYSNIYITDIKVPINCQGVYMNNTFNGCTSLKRIPLLRVNENTTYRQTFLYCNALEELTIEGTIAQNGLNLQWSTKLSKASIISTMNALSTTTSGLSVIFPKTAVDREFEDGNATGSESQEWETLIATKPNWAINLV